jgi:hypothetical protein
MIGDLLGATGWVSYGLDLPGILPVGSTLSPVEAEPLGVAALRSSKIAENNSPLPRDRVTFRHNYFHNAAEVTGYTLDGAALIPQGPGTIPSTVYFFVPDVPQFVPLAADAIAGQPLPPVVQLQTVTRSYDINTFTFAAETTFADGMASVELRVPFDSTLSSDLDLNASALEGLNPVPTPDQTFGRQAAEWGNMTLILKALLHSTPDCVVSGGFAFGIPSGPDTHVRVTDVFSYAALFTPDQPGGGSSGIGFLEATEALRLRDFQIANDTWSLSPYIAALYAPNERLFGQGFLQVEVPLNQNEVKYTRQLLLGRSIESILVPDSGTNVLYGLRNEYQLQEQTLLHVDVGAGYWLHRNPEACFLTGLAGQLELHYTGTLNDADTAVIPAEAGSYQILESIRQGQPVPQTTSATIGNTANRLDILNLTAGTTLLIHDRATVASAFVFPLQGGSNRLFDWEFNLQLNYYFDVWRE